ncbi:MAG: Glu-tRNA(Gln) amidotransferase subunit GatD, partial [Nitrososphaera sp.]
MTEGESGGYRGDGRGFLSRHHLSIGDSAEVVTVDGKLSGIIMPRYEAASDEFIVIKLKSGYNVGIKIPKI